MSGGEKHRVAIARALAGAPSLILADEPTASLDPDVSSRVRAGLRWLCDDHGTALLITSHDMREVERLAERVVFLLAGRIVADGTPEDIALRYERDDLEGVFLHLAEESRR